MSLHGKVAVVTGAAGLLGREHCRALREAGATVVATDLERPEGIAAELSHAGDITRPDDVTALRDEVLRRFDRIDVLVNNAALNERVERPDATAADGRVETYPLDAWRRALDVNVTGTFVCCQVLGATMARRGAGSIINVASTYGLVAPDQALYRRPDGTQPFHKSPAYATTKAAVIGLTRHLASAWGGAGVRVNALAPGGVENDQEPYFVDAYARRTMLGRMARPSEMGGALVFLAGDGSAYMTGAVLVIDGGFTAW
jgi:NAD(P)-dependent dehydrogenase (short-subunit alcohol dehydrogenase family)